METQEYTAKEGESFSSISAIFGMNLLKLNDLTESSLIYPGMILKVKKLVQENKEEIKQNLKNEEMEVNSPKSSFVRECVYYCTGQGDILGTLTVTQAIAMFDPNLIYYESKQQEVLKFQLCIDLCDLVNVNVLEKKAQKQQQEKIESSEGQQFEQEKLQNELNQDETDIIIQLLLSNTQSIKSKRISREPVAQVFFKIAEKKVTLSPRSFQSMRQNANQLEEILRQAIE